MCNLRQFGFVFINEGQTRKVVSGLEDKAIIDLYFQRNEEAIKSTEEKYGRYLYTISNNVLDNNEDSCECVNDTYLTAWNTIPPQKPLKLSAYLGKIARNLAINRYKFNNADKRNKNLEAALSEMEGFLPSPDFAEDTAQELTFKSVLNRFLYALPEEKCNMFILRYWYLFEISEIAVKMGISEAKVKTTLLRLREKLKKILEKEGLHV